MDDWKLPWDGGCLCGQVRFRVSAAPLLAMACHCSGCQRLTASAFSLTLAIPADGLALLAGATGIGGVHGPHRQEYCPHCKSWLFTRPQGLDFMVNVRATMLDDHAWFAPFVETYTSEKLPWAQTPARHSFATFPEEGGFAPLIEAFAREGARP
jgi:hypothetical protein